MGGLYPSSSSSSLPPLSTFGILKLLVLLVFILLPLLVNRYCVWLVADTVEGRHSHQFVCLYLEVKQDLSLAIFKLPWGRCA